MPILKINKTIYKNIRLNIKWSKLQKSYFKVYNNNFSAEMIPSCNENMKSPREKMIEHR